MSSNANFDQYKDLSGVLNAVQIRDKELNKELRAINRKLEGNKALAIAAILAFRKEPVKKDSE